MEQLSVFVEAGHQLHADHLVILNNDENMDESRAARPVQSIPGVPKWTRVRKTPFERSKFELNSTLAESIDTSGQCYGS